MKITGILKEIVQNSVNKGLRRQKLTDTAKVEEYLNKKAESSKEIIEIISFAFPILLGIFQSKYVPDFKYRTVVFFILTIICFLIYAVVFYAHGYYLQLLAYQGVDYVQIHDYLTFAFQNVFNSIDNSFSSQELYQKVAESVLMILVSKKIKASVGIYEFKADENGQIFYTMSAFTSNLDFQVFPKLWKDSKPHVLNENGKYDDYSFLKTFEEVMKGNVTTKIIDDRKELYDSFDKKGDFENFPYQQYINHIVEVQPDYFVMIELLSGKDSKFAENKSGIRKFTVTISEVCKLPFELISTFALMKEGRDDYAEKNKKG